MLSVSLINMPFAPLEYPVLGLTQLKTMMESKFQGRVAATEALYLNLDFAQFMGIDFYQFMCRSEGSTVSGYGDWFFRQSAFPEEPDNSDIYFRRYFPVLSDEVKKIKSQMLEKRDELDAYLEELIEKYRLDEADIVGFTSMFAQNAACFAMARKLKEKNPGVLVVMGGSNCESPMGQEIIKHVRQVDYIFSGPALKSFPQFLEAILAGERERCEKIKGVFTRDNVLNPPSIAGDEVDINESAELNYAPFLETVREKFPNREVKPILVFETSRGCWWGEKAHCTFCGLNGLSMNYRSMRPEKAIKQITSLFQYREDSSHYMCIDNIMPTNYPTEVFPHLDVPPNTSLFYEVKADLTAEEMQALSHARVKLIQPGIEALSTSTLKLMKKGTTAFQNLAFLKNCLLYDLYPVWNILVGFPGEEESVYEKYLEDLPSLVHLPAPNQTSRVLFDRYSPYHTQPEQYGIDLRPCDFYQLIYPFSKETLANIAYHFVDHNYSAPYFGYLIKWLGKLEEQVVKWQERWKVEDASLHPKLYVKENGNGPVVYDTRQGEAIEHPLNDTRRQMLELLHKPKRVSQLAKEMTEVPVEEISREMEWLKERGLVFFEGDRFFGLPLPRETHRFSIKLNIDEQEFSEVV
ncbi:MAG TPA: RiPP maturation radical SAM C-methyltransferase [Pyrinomonadaceae bacterium]|nr:RiPP maturation radical SAM C-methyltransferase [Pyrinomonadaceae bacterium]